MTYLPVFGIALQHHGVLRLADIAVLIILDLGGSLLGLDTVIFRESALMAGTASVGKEVRAHGLEAALRGSRDLSDGLEILVCNPALEKGR